MTVPVIMVGLLGAGVWLVYDSLTGGGRRGRAVEAGSRRPAPGRLRRLLRYAGGEASERDLLLLSLGCALAAFLAALLLLDWPLVALACAGVAALLPSAALARAAAWRRATRQRDLAAAIAELRDTLGAGHSVQVGLAGLAAHGPVALRHEFGRLVAEARLLGVEAALEGWRDRLADPLADQVATALILSERLGGHNLRAVLDRLAAATRAELAVQQEIRAYRARAETQARLLALLPLVVLVVLRRWNPDYLVVFDSPAGQLVLIGCLIWTAVGFAWMRWLTRLPGAGRRLFAAGDR
ncbi:MAG TPA: type II secretion system F family protein [Thermomicrobiales bacterium]|nr:type II secretion system F family protein [Thermomicrobiales bacterium]